MKGPAYRAVLFDLDGTLADTAPDLIAALDHVRAGLDLAPVDRAGMRALAGGGAVGLLQAGLSELAPDARLEYRQPFLDYYAANCWRYSRPYDGIETILAELERRRLPWGVVTNKLEFLARAVMVQAGWLQRAACLVAGDSAARPKPAPDPVLLACRNLELEPGEILLVGDDRRDIFSGQAAGAGTAVALWGYIGEREEPEQWNADWMMKHPTDLRAALKGGPEDER